VVRKRWPVGFLTTKPDEQTPPPFLIELPPQNAGMSALRLNVSSTASWRWSMRPGYWSVSGSVTDSGAFVLSTTLPVSRSSQVA
jgi:hypothetical protein